MTITYEEAIANALNILAKQEDYLEIRNNLLTIVGIPKTAFIDDPALLNVLVQYGRECGGPEALLPMLKIIDMDAVGDDEEEFEEAGETEADETEADEQNTPGKESVSTGGRAKREQRKTYQTSYMRDRRRRYKKATAIKLASLPGHIRSRLPKGLSRQSQEQFEEYLNKFWEVGKAKALTGLWRHEEKRDAGRRYWDDLERQLDETLELLHDPKAGSSTAAAVKKVIGEWQLPDKGA